MGRWTRFLIVIAIGAAIGMFYGWVINEVEYVNTAPDSLRVDYKADFVLMVAEAYQVEHNLGLAARRLALLGADPPQQIISESVLFATQIGYDPIDLEMMQTLAEDFQSWNPSLEVPNP